MIISILFSQIALAACINATPYKSIDQYIVGNLPPETIVLEKDFPSWGNVQNFRFELNPNGKIKRIQHKLSTAECVLINGIQISDKLTQKKAQRIFPKCEFDAGFGGSVLQCNGFSILWSSSRNSRLRIDIANEDIESVHAEKAKSQAESIIQIETKKYPWIKK